MSDQKQMFAVCTPNSVPDVGGWVQDGYQLNVLDEDMKVLATIDLSDWEMFRPVSAGHRLIEHGYMIRPDARGPETVNGWRPVHLGFMVPVISTDDVVRAAGG